MEKGREGGREGNGEGGDHRKELLHSTKALTSLNFSLSPPLSLAASVSARLASSAALR